MNDRPASIHASAAVVGTKGFVIRGPSNSGKSRLTGALVDQGRKSGMFARWVADDRIFLRAVNDRLVTTAPQETAGLAEFRNLGIVPTDHLPSAIVDLIVDLVPENQIERIPERANIVVDDISVPLLLVPQKQLAVSVPLVLAALSKLTDSGHQTRE